MPRPLARTVLFVIVLLSTPTLWSQQTAPAASTWSVSQPYPNNPLRLVTAAGSATNAGETRSAELQIECRAPQLARLNLRFRAQGLTFNVDPFEGPPGIGQKRKLLTMQLDSAAAVPHFSNGFYAESDVFVFAVAPSRSEMSHIVDANAAGKQFEVHVSPADGRGYPLVFHFTLPANNAAAEDVARPCNNSKAKNREPDPQ